MYCTIIDELVVERKRRGLSTVQLADLVGVTRNSINNWEAKRSGPTLQLLCLWASKLDRSITAAMKRSHDD